MMKGESFRITAAIAVAALLGVSGGMFPFPKPQAAFAFDPNDPNGYYMPYHYSDKNAVVYTGTHDNHTVKGWIKEENTFPKFLLLFGISFLFILSSIAKAF